MPRFKNQTDVASAEQWFPGKYVMGVTETVYDPGDGTTQSSGTGYLNEAKPTEPWHVKPGDWIVRYDTGIVTIVPEHIFFDEWQPLNTLIGTAPEP